MGSKKDNSRLDQFSKDSKGVSILRKEELRKSKGGKYTRPSYDGHCGNILPT